MVRHLREQHDFPSFDSSRLNGRRQPPKTSGDQLSDMSNEPFAAQKQRLTSEDNMFDGYAKHPVNNVEFGANFWRSEDSNFYPKFSNQRMQFYNDEQRNFVRRPKWKFTNRQRNYFDQYIIKPTRHVPLFRRTTNLHLNPNEDHRSTQFDYYYNQQINDPRRWGRKKPPKRKNRHWDEYFQPNMYGRDNSFQSVAGLDEKRLRHEEYFKDKSNDMPH